MDWKKSFTKREKEVLSQLIRVIQGNLKPKRILLFGSRAKGKFAKNADFDLAVDCPPPPIEKKFSMEEEIDQASGLYKVDLVFLSEVDKNFKEIILQTGKTVYAKRH